MAETREMQPRAQDAWSSQKLEDAGGTLCRVLREHSPTHTLVSEFWPSAARQHTLLAFSPHVWSFVTTAVGNQCSPSACRVSGTLLAALTLPPDALETGPHRRGSLVHTRCRPPQPLGACLQP